MSKQDIIDSIDRVQRMLSISVSSGMAHEIMRQAQIDLAGISRQLETSIEYRPGDKAILQAVIADMPKHPHVDDTVSRRALERMVWRMND